MLLFFDEQKMILFPLAGGITIQLDLRVCLMMKHGEHDMLTPRPCLKIQLTSVL